MSVAISIGPGLTTFTRTTRLDRRYDPVLAEHAAALREIGHPQARVLAKVFVPHGEGLRCPSSVAITIGRRRKKIGPGACQCAAGPKCTEGSLI